MTLLEKLNGDLKTAMKAGEKGRVEVLRFSLAGVNAALKDKIMKHAGDTLADEEVIEVLRRDAKRRREALVFFRQGERADLVAKEAADLKIIMGYLPEELSAAEIERTIDRLKKKGFKDFNSLMREAMKEMKGRADGKTVGDVIKKKLG